MRRVIEWLEVNDVSWISWSTAAWVLVALIVVGLLGWMFGAIAARFNPTEEEAAAMRRMFGGDRDL